MPHFTARARSALTLCSLLAVLAVPVTPAAAQTVNPTPVPVNPFVIPQNLITNGGFETNAGAPWFIGGPSATIDKVPHCGSLSLRLGGLGNGAAFYRVTLPNNLARADVTFWYQVQSTEPTPSDRTTWRDGDYLEVKMASTSGGGGVTEYIYARDSSVPRNVWTAHHFWNMAAWAGQTMDLSFKAFSNATNATWFFIDDVALMTGLTVMPGWIC
jgi:hypothetical protein